MYISCPTLSKVVISSGVGESSTQDNLHEKRGRKRCVLIVWCLVLKNGRIRFSKRHMTNSHVILGSSTHNSLKEIPLCLVSQQNEWWKRGIFSNPIFIPRFTTIWRGKCFSWTNKNSRGPGRGVYRISGVFFFLAPGNLYFPVCIDCPFMCIHLFYFVFILFYFLLLFYLFIYYAIPTHKLSCYLSIHSIRFAQAIKCSC